MTTATREKLNISKIRKELAWSGACPFAVAAAALEQNERLQDRIAQLERQLLLRPSGRGQLQLG